MPAMICATRSRYLVLVMAVVGLSAGCSDGSTASQQPTNSDAGATPDGTVADGQPSDGQSTDGQSADGPSSDGTIHQCGNGIVDEGEVCDDGNVEEGDTCSADCSRFARLKFRDQTVCAHLPNDTLRCFGAKSYERSDIKQFSMSANTLCTVNGAGNIECFGSNTDVDKPALWPAGSFASVHRFSWVACALDAEGTPSCFGDDGLLNQSLYEYPEGAKFKTLTHASPGFDTGICGIQLDGTIACWGEAASTVLSDIPQGNDFIAISGENHMCALHASGKAECWGSESSPAPDNAFIRITVGENFACGLQSDGAVSCWGASAAIQTLPNGPFVEIAAAYQMACGVRPTGGIECWGNTDQWGVKVPPDLRPPGGQPFEASQLDQIQDCSPNPADGTCVACLRGSCCDTAMACGASVECKCVVDCFTNPAHASEPDCLASRCGLTGGSFEPTPMDVVQCVQSCPSCT